MGSQLRIVMDDGGSAALLKSVVVEAELVGRMHKALLRAQATAPVVTGTYKKSLSVTSTRDTDRIRVFLQSTCFYAMEVEAVHGTLGAALDAAGGAR